MARRPKKSEQDIDVEAAEESLAPTEDEVVIETEDVEDLQCGEALYIARTEQGLTTQDVAQQLRLSHTQIEALEQDDFASLPESTIVKGFIRNYAKLLKIPVEPLLNAYVQLAPQKEDYAFALNPGINMKITESRKSNKLTYLLAAVVLLVAAGVWFFYQSYVQKPSPVTPMPEAAEMLPELELPQSEQIEGVTPLEMPTQPETLPTEVAKQNETSTTSIENAEPKTSDAETEQVAEEQHQVEPEANEIPAVTEQPPVAGATRVEFSATQETWLSIVNADGREVYNKILYAGDRDSVDVRRPSEIVVGNAHGAMLVIDGKTIDLAPYTRINVARYRFNR